MAKEKVTVTLDADHLAGLRDLVGASSLSAGVSDAIAARLVQLRHQAAAGGSWLAEMEVTDGPVSGATMAHAKEAFAELDATAVDPVRRTG